MCKHGPESLQRLRRDPRAEHGEIERGGLAVQQRPLHPADRADLTAGAGHTGRRRDMIVETAVLVVGDQQQGLVEHLGVRPQRLVDGGDQALGPGEVRLAAQREIVVGGVADQVVLGVLAVAQVRDADQRRVVERVQWRAVIGLDERVGGQLSRGDMVGEPQVLGNSRTNAAIGFFARSSISRMAMGATMESS